MRIDRINQIILIVPACRVSGILLYVLPGTALFPSRCPFKRLNMRRMNVAHGVLPVTILLGDTDRVESEGKKLAGKVAHIRRAGNEGSGMMSR